MLLCITVHCCVLLCTTGQGVIGTTVYCCVLRCAVEAAIAYYCVLFISIYNSDLQLSMLVGFRPWPGHKEGMISGRAAVHAEHDRDTAYR